MKPVFKSKHVVVAMLVAPVLAIIAWFAVDYLVAETPHAAKAGAVYSLVAKPNCRYNSGQCDLKNADFELTLRATGVTAAGAELELESKFSLQNATIALVDTGNERQPTSMVRTDAGGQRWRGTIPRPVGDESTIRIAVIAKETAYYAEVPVVFLRFEF